MNILILSAILRPEEEVKDSTDPYKPPNLRSWHQYYIKNFIELGDTVTALNFLKHGVHLDKKYNFLLLLTGGTNFRYFPGISKTEKKIPIITRFNDTWEHYSRDLRYADIFRRTRTDIGLVRCLSTLEWYRKDNLPVVWYPAAIDPDYFYPMDIKKRYDIFFSGNGRPKRTKFLDLLAKNFKCDFHVHSSPLSKRWPSLTGQIEAKAGAFEAYRRGINSAKIGFECSKEGDFGERPCEIMACKTAALVEDVLPARKLFEVDKEVVLWKDWSELFGKATMLLGDKKKRDAIAEAGYKKVLAKHTIKERIKYIKKLYEAI